MDEEEPLNELACDASSRSEPATILLELFRSSPRDSRLGVFGELYINGKYFCKTCEANWQDNKPGVSCVPSGSYECVPHWSPRFKLATISLHNPQLNVYGSGHAPPDGTGRTYCLIHPGNWAHQVQGCILVGEAVCEIPHEGVPTLGVNRSRATFDALAALWGDRTRVRIVIDWAAQRSGSNS